MIDSNNKKICRTQIDEFAHYLRKIYKKKKYRFPKMNIFF